MKNGVFDKSDWDEIKLSLKDECNCYFSYSHDGVSLYQILITLEINEITPYIERGHTEGRAFISILGYHPFHFINVGYGKFIHPSYFQEKLGIEKDFAEHLSEMWSYIWRRVE